MEPGDPAPPQPRSSREPDRAADHTLRRFQLKQRSSCFTSQPFTPACQVPWGPSRGAKQGPRNPPVSRDALWGGHHRACPPGVVAEPPGAGGCGSATVRGGWPRLAWRSGSLCGPLVGVPRAAMPKARASALGLPAVRLAQEVPSALKQRASAGHTSEDRNPGAAQAGGAQTAAPASAEWCRPPRGAGRTVGSLVHVCGAPGPGHSGEGLAGRQLDAKCFSDTVRRREAQAPGPRDRAGSRPTRPPQAWTRGWDSLGHSFSPQDAAEPPARVPGARDPALP